MFSRDDFKSLCTYTRSGNYFSASPLGNFFLPASFKREASHQLHIIKPVNDEWMLINLLSVFREDSKIYSLFRDNTRHFSVTMLTLLCCLYFSVSFGQPHDSDKFSESGQPFIKYYGPKAYNALAANWKIIQDKRGLMYFGNGSGVLEFDGISWRKIQVPNSNNVRSLTLGDDGTIYVCASNDFGYLEPDTLGKLKYISLKPYLDKKYHNYGEMWDVSTSSTAVFFKTDDKIFKWDGRQMSVLDSVFAFRLYKIGDTIYSRNQGTGLMMIDGDSLKLMPDGAFFATTGVYNMIPFKEANSNQNNKVLITTNLSGLFLHDGEKFTPFKTEVDSFLIESQIYNACAMNDGNYAFATQRGGVVIIDSKGRLVRMINEDSGLPTNVVYDVYTDRHGGLWLATLYGIVYCEASSPFSIFQKRGALNNMSASAIRFDGSIYVANELGVLYLSDRHNTYELVEGSNKPAYKFFNADGVLLAATNGGLVIIEQKKIMKFIIRDMAVDLVASKIYPGRIYVGTRKGITIIQKTKYNRFGIIYQGQTDDEVNSIVEDKDGNLWLAGYFSGIYYVTGDLGNLSTGTDHNLKFKFYNKHNGLPGNKWDVYDIQGKMLLTTDKGVFSFDKNKEVFIPDSTLGTILSDSARTVSLIEKSTNDNLWILAEKDEKKDLGQAVLNKNGTYKWEPMPEFRRLELSTASAIYSDYDSGSDKEILWISTEEALVRYDPAIKKDVNANFLTLIRRATVQNDSVIYGGTSIKRQNDNNIVLPFSKNDISFEFSAASFEKSEANQFQYYLEGNDDDWSNWTHEYKKEYTNLSGGDYKFRTRSKNVYGIIGKEDSFHFSVMYPWYFSWWAFSLYALLITFVVFVVDRTQRAKVIKKERERAKLREAELIKKQSEELETIDTIVRVINKELDLESLLHVLLEQGMKLFPQSDNGAVLIFDNNTEEFRFAASIGYDTHAIQEISFTREEITDSYADGAEEVEKGVFVVKRFRNTERIKKFNILPVPKSLILMSSTWKGNLEGVVLFASLSNTEAFDQSDARKLRRFREHTISAIAKARILKELQQKNEKIIKTQQQLITQEKLASLGQLTAGIAHEIKNPLNFVKNFSEASLELMQELRDELKNQMNIDAHSNWNSIEDVMNIIEDNNRRINEHSMRADSIVRSMLQHSRGKTGERRETDINAILDENINLVYHGMRAQDATFNITIEKDFDNTVGKPKVIPQDISRVFLNILQNAFYAASLSRSHDNHPSSSEQTVSTGEEKSGVLRHSEEPTIRVKTKNLGNIIEIYIRDNGPGIPKEFHDKIFNPFFSSKPSGIGTGLGLSIAYDIIVKEHGGEIRFETRDGEFTEFIISIPNKDSETPKKEK